MDALLDTTVIESATDDAPNARTWKDFVALIRGLWRKSAYDFIAVGQLLLAAKEELARDAFAAMIKDKLDFDSSVGRKLMRIAANATLCAPGHNLPANWTILHILAQLPEATLKAALADGRIYRDMSRADAHALKPSKKTAPKAKTSASASTALNAVWQAASWDERQAFFDRLGCDGICAVMSSALLADLRDRAANLNTAGASQSSVFSRYCTDKFHSALACAEQKEPNEASLNHMRAALGLIVKKAATEGISRSDIVIVRGKPKGRK